MSEKIYTEEEVSALLGRAARLQAAKGPSGQAGLTLEEIKTAASEAGIDPRFVEMASSVSSDHEQAHWTIPTGVGRTLAVGGTLTDDRWSQMVAVFSRELGGPGETASQGMRRTWSRGTLRATAEEVGGQTLLHIEADWEKELELPIALTLVGAVAAGTTGALALVSLEWTIGLVAALAAILVVGSFSAYRSRTKAKKEALRSTFEATLDRCAVILQDEAVVDVEKHLTKPGSVSDRIQLPDEEPTEDVTMSVSPPSRRNNRSGL